MIKILFLHNSQAYDGCSWYRMHQFKDTAKRLNIADVQFLDVSVPAHTLAETISKTDVFVSRLHDGLLDFYDEYGIDKLHKPIILDIDDSYDEVDPLSDMYQVLGTKDVKLDDGRFLWKTGERNFDRRENRKRLEIYHKTMERVDAMTVTTFGLKQYANEYNKVAAVIPNAIHPELFPPIKINKPRDEVRLLWSGGASHYSDLAEVKDVIVDLMKKYPNLHYYHVGQVFNSIVKDMPQDRVHTYHWTRPEAHGYRMATMGADIGICPLIDSTFNTYKSSIKYYEYSALGLTTLARNIAPYTDDIANDKNGLLYSTTQEFKEKLEELITDPIKRMTIAQQAYDYTIKHRNIEDITRDWVSFLENLKTAYTP